MFNFIISLPYIVCLVWIVIFLINYRKLHRANRFLILWITSAMLCYFSHYAYYSGLKSLLPYIEPIYVFCNQAVFPLYLIYILKLTKEDFRIKKYLLLFIPALILSLTSHFARIAPNIESIHNSLMITCFVGNTAIFAYVATRSIIEYKKKVMNYYSDVKEKDLRYIERLKNVIVITVIPSLIINGLTRKYFIDSQIPLMFLAVTYAILFFLICYYSLRQAFTIEDVVRDENTPIQSIETQEPNQIIASIEERIENLFIGEHIYLTPDLTISTIAQRLSTNRTYVSKVINKNFGVSFNQYVNQHRVERAKDVMRENPDMKHYLVAEKSGFANEQSFYRNFKKIEERTPQAWLKGLK